MSEQISQELLIKHQNAVLAKLNVPNIQESDLKNFYQPSADIRRVGVRRVGDESVKTGNYEVLIVGGGPVGMYLAIQLYVRGQRGILILQDRKKYTREQILLVSKASVETFPSDLRRLIFSRNGEGCRILPPPVDFLAKCYLDGPENWSITTHRLESIMMSYIMTEMSDGISVDYIQIKKMSPKDAAQVDDPCLKYDKQMKLIGDFTLEYELQPDDGVGDVGVSGGLKRAKFKFLVGCDGGGSYVRRCLMKIGQEPFKFPQVRDGVVMMIDLMHYDHHIEERPDPSYQRMIERMIQLGQQQHRYRLFRDRKRHMYIGLQVKNPFGIELLRDYRQRLREIEADPTRMNSLGLSIMSHYGCVESINGKGVFSALPLEIRRILRDICSTAGFDCRAENIQKFCANYVPISHEIAKLQDIPIEKIHMFLSGDAIYGTHFFSGTGVNYGFSQAMRVVDFLMQHGNKYNRDPLAYTVLYRRFMKDVYNENLSRIRDLRPFYNYQNLYSESVLGRWNYGTKQVGSVTDFDSPFIQGKPPGTCSLSSGDWNAVVAAFLTPVQPAPISQKKTAIFVVGLPLSGKTTAVEFYLHSLNQKHSEFVIINIDQIQTFLTSYKQFNEMPNPKHKGNFRAYSEIDEWCLEVSERIAHGDDSNSLFSRAVNEGKNIIYYSSCLQPHKCQNLLRQLMGKTLQNEYNNHLIGTWSRLPVLYERALERALAEGRWMDRDTINSLHYHVNRQRMFQLLEDFARVTSIYDNSLPNPIKIMWTSEDDNFRPRFAPNHSRSDDAYKFFYGLGENDENRSSSIERFPSAWSPAPPGSRPGVVRAFQQK